MQAGKAELGGSLSEALVGGAAALAGATDLRWGAMDAGLVNEPADHINSGVEFSGELGQARVGLAASGEVAVQCVLVMIAVVVGATHAHGQRRWGRRPAVGSLTAGAPRPTAAI